MSDTLTPPPVLVPMTRIVCAVGELVTLGDAPYGERRYVPLGDGAAAHYVIRTDDGALVEVRSEGMRHGPPEVMARLASGEAVPSAQYFFRTVMRFTTGDARWQHLNKVIAIARGEREARAVKLEVYRLA